MISPSINSLSFDTSGWKFHGEQQPNQKRLWETPEHDAVILHFFGIAPDIPPIRSMGEMSAFYANGLKPSGGKVVECGLAQLAGCPSIRLIIKVPQKPSGMMYQGVFTIPFRDFSFVIKVQCEESGMTGVREAILFDQRRRSGEMPNLDPAGPFFSNWNPDAPEHDQSFPTHPISRLRRLLARLASTATLDPGVRDLPGFPLPEGTG